MANEVAPFDTAHVARVTALVSELAHRDLSGLPQRELMDAHAAVARLGRLTDTLLARFAAEIAVRSTPDLPGGGLARRQGFVNAGSMVAKATGGSQADARRAIDAGLALLPAAPTQDTPRYPAVAEASLAGELSVDSAAIITSGLELLADRVASGTLHQIERKLVDMAKSRAAHEVRGLVARAVARADLPGHEEREKRQHEERFIAWKEDHTGMVTLQGRLDAVTAAPFRTVIEQMVTQQFRMRRDHDPRGQQPSGPDQRTVGQMRADALFDLCRHALGCRETEASGVRTTIVVRMTKRDLDAGEGLGAVDGVATPVSLGALRRLAGDAGIVPEVLGGDSEVLDLGRTQRLFSKAQRLAMLERDGGCAKCHAPPEHCEAHHIRWWDKGGGTDLSNGVMLCTRCHHDIHRFGWEIVVHANRVSFIPPPPVDPLRRPMPGGASAIDIGDLGVPPDYWDEAGDDHWHDQWDDHAEFSTDRFVAAHDMASAR
jgi:hypothetical protein